MAQLSIVTQDQVESAPSHSKRIEFANTLRGIACLFVVFAHYAGVFWEAPQAVSSLTGMPAYTVTPERMPAINWLDNAIPNLQWGPLGVAVFFLISGFVIPFSLTRQTVVQFVISRTVRIWPTYLCGFAVTVATIWLGAWSFGAVAPFASWEVAIHAVPGIRDLIGSRNIDGIIWTLEIEIKFYALCALTAVWLRSASPKLFMVPMAIGGLALMAATQLPSASPLFSRLATTYINSSQFLVFMYIGVAFHFLYSGAIPAKQVMAWIGSLAMMVCLVWSASPYKATFPQAWNYGIAVCLFAWAMSYPHLLRSNRLFDAIAAISYPLYVVHGVAGYVMMRWLYASGASPLLCIILTTIAATLTAWLLHVWVEMPTQRLGKYLITPAEPVKQPIAGEQLAA